MIRFQTRRQSSAKAWKPLCLTWIAVIAFGWAAPSKDAAAGEFDKPSLWHSLRSRPALFDGPGSTKQALRESGIDVHAWLTQFYQGVVAGNGNRHWQYGGKLDLILGVDMSKLGLWRGFSVNVHQELVYGKDANNQGNGTLFPVNTALAFPPLGGYEQDTSIVVTQAITDRLSISLGKFNMLEAAWKKPLIGGGGLDTVMNTALAAPISGVTPPYLFGTIATLKTDPAIFTLMVYDPRNAQGSKVIENPFSEGTTTSLSATVPLTISGLQGFYGLRGVYSSQEGLDLASIPALIDLPPASERILTKTDYWYLNPTVYQYLHQARDNPAVGWGFFVDAAVSDGNPNPIKWHLASGLAGQGLFPGREQDRWGIGYFKYGLSNELVRGLATIGSALARIIHQDAIGRREAGRRGASFRGVDDAAVGV